jgi:predicted PurR-regulated permease PerM
MKPSITEPFESDWGSHSHIHTLVLISITALGVVLCYLLAAPFLPALGWALTLAVLFAPLQGWLESKLKHPNLAATISVLVIGLIVVVPSTFVVQRLAIQAINGAALIQSKVESGDWRRALEAQPRMADLADKIEHDFDLTGTASQLATWLSGIAGSIVRGSVIQVIGFCLIFYLLFFLLRDRHSALNEVRSLSPLSDSAMNHLFARVSDTIHATIYGTLMVSATQGTLGGFMFWWLGLPAPLLWGVVMGLLAVVPVLGAFIVWIPAVLILLLEGSFGKALILTLWGMFVVGTIDNLLRPSLVGQRLRLHTVLAFISEVGGLMVFGPAGVVLGPVALTVTSELLRAWPKQSAVILIARTEPGASSRIENEGGPPSV